jgi:translation initiation factor 2B subunit (eIF-2B alpha/beta/delta family)
MEMKIEELKNMHISGSYLQSRYSLYVLRTFIKNINLKDSEEITQKFNKLGRDLIKLQPNMVAVRKHVTTVVYYMKRLVKANKSLEEIKSQTIEKINETLHSAERNLENIATNGSKLILNHSKILTISYSSSLKEIFTAARKQKRKFEVYCLESRPALEGQLLAEELAKSGIASYVVTDVSMAQIAREVNVIICGADRVFENAFVNKIGTLPLAIVANKFQIPLYIVCDTEKILKEIDNAVRFYPQEPDEVYISKNSLLHVSNYHFESIPLEYVSKVVNEEGIYDTVEFMNWYLEE